MNLEEKAKDEFNDHIEFCEQKRQGYRCWLGFYKRRITPCWMKQKPRCVKCILKHTVLNKL